MESSHSAFAKVDEMVKKAVHGSDGAISWQTFRKNHQDQKSLKRLGTVAPQMPVKVRDRKNTGLENFEQERLHEAQMRQQHNPSAAPVGEYVDYKGEAQRLADQKQHAKLLELAKKRVRPEHAMYFIKADTFQGSKKDYIFTTQSSYGTGYYWDGMDSALEAMEGKLSSTFAKEEDNPMNKKNKTNPDTESSTVAQEITMSTSLSTRDRAMEQVAAAIARRQQPTMNDEQLAAAGWASALDPSSGKTYYYNIATKETKWEYPLTTEIVHTITSTDNVRTTTEGSSLPEGWKSAKDASGREYFYHASGKTTWDRPWV